MGGEKVDILLLFAKIINGIGVMLGVVLIYVIYTGNESITISRNFALVLGLAMVITILGDTIKLYMK